MKQISKQIYRIVFFTLLFILVTSISGASDTNQKKSCTQTSCSEYPPAVKALAPVARILIIDAAMYSGMAAIWPQAYAPSKSSSAQLKKSWNQAPYWNRHSTFFELDDDPWQINGILHGVYGSEAYIAARTWGKGPVPSFFYSLFASLTWEYMIEGFYQQPSAIDMMWTPVAGTVLGELRYQLLVIAHRKISKKAARITVMTLIDPIGQLERLICGCRFKP
ncbi:MAG: DUF3943 domain-containing protein [Deltaproteobacteria bacterium]|nr:DUF3943 domain-containing protein [Deltaproteobacteria bacterium]